MTLGTLSREGATLAYEVTGSGPPVVLVHGFGLDMRMWQPQVPDLARRYQVIRYDCRGFGRSGELDPAVPYAHHEDLVAVLDHLGVETAAVVGLSFGGQVALHTALAAPSRVRALALLDPLLDGVAWDPESLAGLDDLNAAVAEGGVPAGRAAWMAHPLFAAARRHSQIAAELRAMVEDYPGQHWLGRDPHRRVESPPLERLHTIDVPTLVIVGALDVPCFREMSGILAERIPHAEHHTIDGAGHMVNLEAPNAVNDLLLDFLDRVAR